MGIWSPYRPEERRDALYSPGGKNVSRMVPTPREMVCSFCGVATHSYKECPVLHQYIREQANELAQRRLGEYQQVQDQIRRDSPKRILAAQQPLWRGGGPHEQGEVSKQEPTKQEIQKGEASGKKGIIGSLYSNIVGSMVPGGGGEPPPPGGQGPPEDKSDDRSTDEGEEADEETVSVTSSSPTSVNKTKTQRWDKGKEMYVSGAGDPPEDPEDPSKGGDDRETSRGPRGHRGQRGRTGSPG